MSIKSWVWKSVIAGFAGTIVHFAFMYAKSRLGILPSFQPYPAFQATLSRWLGTDVPAIVPWLLSFLNGMTILGFLFARLQRLLPGRTGASKGLAFGLIGWLFMDLIFFPMIGLRPFAVGTGLGIAPATLSLGMVLTYSIVLGTVYVALDPRGVFERSTWEGLMRLWGQNRRLPPGNIASRFGSVVALASGGISAGCPWIAAD